MAHAKDKHYWTQLRSTVVAGSWDSSSPAKAPNGASLSWSELLRKFNKHCTGYADVAELVSQTQALSLLLAANAPDLDGDDTRQPNTLTLGDECVLLEERAEEGSAGYNVLKSLQSSNSEPVKLAIAFYAYALGRPAETLELLNEISKLEDIKTRVTAYGTMHLGPLKLQVPTSGADSASSSRTGSMVSVATTTGTEPGETGEARAWAVTECVRSIALKAMSHEKLSPSDPLKALSVYEDALPVLDTMTAEIQGSLTNSQTQNISEVRSPSAPSSFTKYRELWRWSERLLRRAIILASATNDLTAEDGHLWKLLNMYRTCSVHWPASFRPRHRSTVAILHLRAFVLRAEQLQSEVLKAKAPRWISTARSIIQEYRALLSACTQFPRAGERNVRVEDFVDLCVAVWEADGAAGENAEWVIDCLWWATRLTFNSFRIYRHMSRLLAVSGDPELARRTLKLYIQVVSKAREAGSADSNLDPESESGIEMDTDRQWVETLVQGSRTLCRMALQEQEYGKAVEIAKEAGTVLEKARTRLDQSNKQLIAGVQLAEGIWHSVMAHIAQDPRTRTSRLSESLTSLLASVGTYPTPSAHHHLALALSRPGPSKDMQTAIEHARAAVEGDASELRHWHLLGLLLAATGDWKAAKGVLEIGISLAEADLDEGDHTAHESNGLSEGLNIRDFGNGNMPNGTNHHPVVVNGNGATDQVNGHIETTAVPRDATVIPPSATLLHSLGDRPRPSRQESFEYALQMRMTQLALTEFVEGAEGVGEKWLEVFHWFREQRPSSMDDARKSIDSRRVSEDTPRPSSTASVRTQQPASMARVVTNATSPSMSLSEHDEDLLTPIPITVTPASPGVPPPDFERSPTIRQSDTEKRSASLDEKDRDISRGKKVKEVLKSGVHKGQVRITTISKKIGHGVGRGRHGSLNLKRMTSAPDFHQMLGQPPYQASSIHLRQYHSIHASQQDLSMLDLPPPPPAPTPEQAPQKYSNQRARKDRRLLSDLWLMSAAIFRRLGKVEQAKAAIQEAEVRDEDNPAVWVQLGLYYIALGEDHRAASAFQKALFIHQDDVPATIYLCRIYLTQAESALASTRSNGKDQASPPSLENVDLAAGLLEDLTHGPGWDVAEAWYFLAKAYKLQGRLDRERECLSFALGLAETRGVRDITSAVGWCL